MFAFRQIASRFNTSFLSMSVICVILFFAITSVCSGMSICSAMTGSLKQTTHYDATAYLYYELIQNGDENDPYIENKKQFIQDNGFDLKSNIEKSLSEDDRKKWNSIVRDTAQVDSYAGGLTFADLDKKVNKPLKDYSSSVNEFYTSVEVDIISLSQFNHAREMVGLPVVELGNDEALFNANNNATMEYMRQVCSQAGEVKVFDSTLKVKKNLDTTALSTSQIAEQMGALVVPDSVVPKAAIPQKTFLDIALYQETDQKELSGLLERINSEETGYSCPLSVWVTKQQVLEQAVSLSAIVSYLAIYIGFILVVACAAILAIQQLTDVSDNRTRYRLLSKLGANKKMINRALLIQIGVAFIAPLLLAIAHSVCAISVVESALSVLGLSNVIQMMAITMGIFLLVYGLYFVLTYYISRRVIKES